MIQQQISDAIRLLQQLIATPSFSGEEQGTALLLQQVLTAKCRDVRRDYNNVWVRNMHYDERKPTILLQSHHDTVRPNAGYTLDPYLPLMDGDRLYGLGSNDAGGSLVSLLATFQYFYSRTDIHYNLVFAAVGEEEISGERGIQSLLPKLGPIDCAIVGEPTNMDMAIAERGLLVLDCEVVGEPGHAGRKEGVNSILKAIPVIQWFESYQFPKVSSLLGTNTMSVTIINAGIQHNVVPGRCTFTTDVRMNECYTPEEVLAIVREHVSCTITPRSMRLRPSFIAESHVLVKAGKALGREVFGSPTLSDKALMPFPTLKMGPGDSRRSHSADEFIYLQELEQGIEMYIELIKLVVV